MTSRDFCFWLQGYFELTGDVPSKDGRPWIDMDQAYKIQSHLALVFKHEIDPSMGDKKHQVDPDKIHPGMIPCPEGYVRVVC